MHLGIHVCISLQLMMLQRNTYQVALVTDESRSFLVMNYYNITWANGSEMGCNPKTGTHVGGFYNCIPAQVKYSLFSYCIHPCIAKVFTLPLLYLPMHS